MQRLVTDHVSGTFGKSHFASMLQVCLECSESYSSWDSGKNGNAAREIGHQLGNDLAMRLPPPKSSAPTLDSITEGLSKYLERNGIAKIGWREKKNRAIGRMLKMAWVYGHPLAMRTRRKTEGTTTMLNMKSSRSTRTNSAFGCRTLCGFKEGLLEAIFESKLAQNVNVREVECFGTGAASCVFEVFPIGRDEAV